jgi:hypothetical protein
MKKSRLQYASGVGRTKELFSKGEVRIFLDVGKSALKFKEIMWKSDYVQW